MSKMNQLFGYLNSMPFPLTIRHYFPLERKLDSKEAWDILRQNHPHFSISEDREEWLKAAEGVVKKDGQDGGLIKRAGEIEGVIRENNIKSIFSLGVGGAGLEYQIKKIRPELRLVCSEYSPVAIERLQKVFKEADSIILFDMKNGDWASTVDKIEPARQLYLMYRIDIELTNSEFRKIFEKMFQAGVENILIILCGRLTLRGLMNRLYQRLIWKIRSTKYAFAGFLRTTSTFPRLWKNLYTSKELEFGGLKSFLLKRKV